MLNQYFCTDSNVSDTKSQVTENDLDPDISADDTKSETDAEVNDKSHDQNQPTSDEVWSAF